MIKDLIQDISYDKINLSQALMRAKLIAYEINNDVFKNWINNESNGYSKDTELPDYRIIPCDTFAVLESYNSKKIVPINLSSIDIDLHGKIYKMEVRQSITTIEEGLKITADEHYVYEDFPQQVVTILREMSKNPLMTNIKRRVQTSQISHILNLTKQKLIETLLDLNATFPDLKNNFKDNLENYEKAQTIINTHIYGANSSSNIGVGNNITQSINNVYHDKVERFISELKDLGIPKEDLDDVNEIVTKETDSKDVSKKLLNWVGKMATKAIEKGIDLQIPLILEKVRDFL